MKKKRIVITGMGISSCFGTDVVEFYNKLLAGTSGIVPIQGFPCEEYPTRFAGEIQNFDTGEYLDKKQARRVDPYIRYAIVAGKKALEMSQLTGEAFNNLDKSRSGILVGSGMGGMNVYSDGVETLLTKGFKRLTAIDLGFMGPNYSISTACATANNCIFSAAQHIRNGEADLMVCGGSEAAILPMGLAGFVACKALSERNEDPTKASRPWDKNRDGFVMGEGSGVLVLESLEHALKRGAPILAEYLGGGVSCDANHMTDPRADGLGVKLCIESALKDAQIEKEKINYVNAHATSTLAGDLAEINALRSAFGEHLKNIKINATKSMIGHCLGAAGGLEAVATIQAIRTGMLHPTINLENPEEAVADLDLVPNVAKAHSVSAALSNSFGFGGHNSTLIFAPYTT
ncbi:MAG: beta-ketoacyl-[acyl-carrier-protein] synthase II [Chlamydiae bacterium]|nr:beta-ketoacyl-[acyl-carrier-protein] synthase II [Chlamydiota bacterium]